jgi:hypothetical protein
MDPQLWIKAYGSVTLTVYSGNNQRQLRLKDVVYCPDLLCNLVSFGLLRLQGLWWDNIRELTVLRQSLTNTPTADLIEQHGQWVIEANPINDHAMMAAGAAKACQNPQQHAQALM